MHTHISNFPRRNKAIAPPSHYYTPRAGGTHTCAIKPGARLLAARRRRFSGREPRAQFEAARASPELVRAQVSHGKTIQINACTRGRGLVISVSRDRAPRALFDFHEDIYLVRATSTRARAYTRTHFCLLDLYLGKCIYLFFSFHSTYL